MRILVNKKNLEYISNGYNIRLHSKASKFLKTHGISYVFVPHVKKLEPYETKKGPSEYHFYIDLPSNASVKLTRFNSNYEKTITTERLFLAWRKCVNGTRYISIAEQNVLHRAKEKKKARAAARRARRKKAKEPKFTPAVKLRKLKPEPRKCISCQVYLDPKSHSLTCGFCKQY